MNEEKTVTLKQLMTGMNECVIEYRTYMPDGKDILQGYCAYKEGKLFSLDGDCYLLDDEFVKWEWSPSGDRLTVWYTSKWIEG